MSKSTLAHRFALMMMLVAVIYSSVYAQEDLWLSPPEPLEPTVADASDEAIKAMAAFQVPDGVEASLFAAEPLVANPVALDVDARGRVFVCETFRQEQGIEDNRNHMDWLHDDLAAQTLSDRFNYFRKFLGENLEQYTLQDDRIRLLEDTDGDGRADRSQVFANHFNGVLEGTGASVLARGANVYYTCIPNLWLLSDEDNDGQADQREVLQSGFGIRVAFRGHDLHGLCLGPDGRLYFSVGDRGFNLLTRENRRFVRPYTGAVFRCQLDGSQLEVFAYGLRNPQELAFDQYGNLFTGDNNSDSGDLARWVYLLPGSDAGWRMYYQYLGDRGPWNRERLWHPHHEQQAAYIVPPVANLGDGPSGLVYYPGIGLDPALNNHFLMCDFRGSSGQSGIRSFAVESDGAFFRLVDSRQYIWSILATDLDFDPSGRLLVTDWVHGWNGLGKGRIYRFASPSHVRSEGPELLAGSWQQRTSQQLSDLLSDADQRVRLEAQFELVRRADLTTLLAATGREQAQLKRLHAIWGLGQLGQRDAEQMRGLKPLLDDPDVQVRSQAAKVLGDGQLLPDAVEPLLLRLDDPSPTVQASALIALSRYADRRVLPKAVSILAENDDRDPALRHAAVLSLASVGTSEPLVALADHESVAVRRAAAVALRRLAHPRVAVLLDDAEPTVALEAARAIYDDQLLGARQQLADSITRRFADSTPLEILDAFYRRAIGANLLVGDQVSAERVAELVLDRSLDPSLRRHAVEALAQWKAPPAIDPVLGDWRPQRPRDDGAVSAMVRPLVERLLGQATDLVAPIVELAAQYEVQGSQDRLLELYQDTQQDGDTRASALQALARLNAADWEAAARDGLTDGPPQVRLIAQRTLARRFPNQAVDFLVPALRSDDIQQQQQAVRLLAALRQDKADRLLLELVGRITDSNPPPSPIQLDLLEVARQRSEGNAAFAEALAKYESQLDESDPLDPYRVCLDGGDSARGSEVFFGRSQLSCRRCHNVEGEVVSVGPNLTHVARDNPPEYLLESIIQPNKQISKGFETTILITNDGKTFSGIVREETEDAVILVLPDGQTQMVAKDEIDERVMGLSAMPEDLIKDLTLADLRDLIAFLKTLK